MSLVRLCLVVTLFACGGSSQNANEPQTAKEKQLAEAKKNGELDKKDKKWGTWRYGGERDDCFYVVGRKCFKTEAAACKSAGCGKGAKGKCSVVGGGPATVSCETPKKK
jgi:hypothetical protein